MCLREEEREGGEREKEEEKEGRERGSTSAIVYVFERGREGGERGEREKESTFAVGKI